MWGVMPGGRIYNAISLCWCNFYACIWLHKWQEIMGFKYFIIMLFHYKLQATLMMLFCEFHCLIICGFVGCMSNCAFACYCVCMCKFNTLLISIPVGDASTNEKMLDLQINRIFIWFVSTFASVWLSMKWKM